MKMAVYVFIAIVLAAVVLQHVHAQSTRTDVPVRQEVAPWPTPVSAAARLVSVRPVTRGIELVFQEPNGSVHIVFMTDKAAFPIEGYTVTTMRPPAR